MKTKKQSQRDKIIEFLGDKASYPHIPKFLKHIQTHSSDVFIVPPYVYKVKKPVNFKFLDFSSLEKRKYYCEREVELNRRLTRDIYLGIEQISGNKGKLRFGSGEKIVEYAIKMKRMPEKYFIKNLLKKGLVSKKDFKKVISKLVIFYQNQTERKEISKLGTLKTMTYTINENRILSKRFIGQTLSEVCFETINLYNNNFFKSHRGLFEIRRKEGFIKDCHGDLHLDHINLSPNGINIFDCIEFNDRFRYIDVASDLAFLAMDLDYNGYHNLSEFVVSEFSKKMRDKTINEIIDFYKCYRAYVRGKVESIRANANNISENERMISKLHAQKYFSLALRYALFGTKPIIIVVFGGLASGKSKIAKNISNELNSIVFSSDKLRKELAGIKPTDRVYACYSKGIYSKDNTERTYGELFTRCQSEIKIGNTVILDATFSKRKHRTQARELARKLGTNIIFVETFANDNIIKKRLADREKLGLSVSDGRLDILLEFSKKFQKTSELKKINHIKVNTGINQGKVIKETLLSLMRTNFLLNK